MARKDEIGEMILHQKRELQTIFQATCERLKEEVKRTILSPMEDDESEWIVEARKKCCKFVTESGKKYLQLLKKEGYQQGRGKAKDICWNLELQCLKKDELSGYSMKLRHGLNDCYIAMWREIGDMMDRTKSDIRRR